MPVIVDPNLKAAHDWAMAAVDALVGNPPVRPAVTDEDWAELEVELNARLDALR